MNKIYQQNETFKKKRTKYKQKYFMSYNSYKKCKNVYRNKAIANGLHQYAKAHDFKGFMLTCLAEKSHTSSRTRQELTSKFQKIRQTLRRHNITTFGYKCFKKHQSGLYHLHIMIYVEADKADDFLDIYKRYFNNYVNLNENAIQEVDNNTQYIDEYLIYTNLENDDDEKITKVSSKSDVSFFNLKKGFISKWDYIYKTKRKNLTQDEFRIKNILLIKIMLKL